MRILGDPLGRVLGQGALGAGGSGLTYAQYVALQAEPVWLRLQETSGNPANSGSLSLTITQTAATQGQTGKLGTNEAYDFDGAAASGSIVSIANNATLKAWTTQRWGFLCKLDALGASNAGKMACWGAFGATDHLVMGCVSTNRLQATINADTTNGAAVTNTNQISDCIGAWCWLFMDYDDANTLGNGRKIRLFKGLNGVVTQLTLATDTALVGTVDQPATALAIGNTTGRNLTLDGLVDEVRGKDALWTTNEMLTTVRLTGV